MGPRAAMALAPVSPLAPLPLADLVAGRGLVHLERLPAGDARSRAILVQMRGDEIAHANTGRSLGAAGLPQPIKRAMGLVAKVMTNTA